MIVQLIELRRSRKTYRHIAQLLALVPPVDGSPLAWDDGRPCWRPGPAPAVERYEYTNPGDLLCLDIKKLGRFWRPGHLVTLTSAARRKGTNWPAESWRSSRLPGRARRRCAALIGSTSSQGLHAAI